MELEKIKAIAAEQLKEKRSHTWKERGNKYYHGERVAKLAVTLRKLIFPDDSSHDDILTVAAWFHDIANGGEDHSKIGAEQTRALLTGFCSEAELDVICGIIAVHDDRSMKTDYSAWVKLHQDADHLDHFGTYDIWMTFLFAVPHDKTLDDINSFLTNDRLSKSLQYRSELNFDISYAIFDEKDEFLKSFIARFAVESSGEVWNLEQVLKEANKQVEL
jgi:uncharacterized protein